MDYPVLDTLCPVMLTSDVGKKYFLVEPRGGRGADP